MIFLLYFAVPILLLLKALDLQRERNVELRYKYKLMHLRDELSLAVIDGKVDEGHPLFEPIVKNFTSSIRNGSMVNFWAVLLFLIIQSKDNNNSDIDFLQARKTFRGSAILLSIYNQSRDIYFEYFKEKSRFLYVLLVLTLTVIHYLNKNVNPAAVKSTIKRYVTITNDFPLSFQ